MTRWRRSSTGASDGVAMPDLLTAANAPPRVVALQNVHAYADRDMSRSRGSAGRTPRTRPVADGGEESGPDWLKIGLIADGIGLAVVGIAALADSSSPPGPPKQRVIFGGVDLTDTDLTRPFSVDFSISPHDALELKRAALERLKHAVLTFQSQWPAWSITTEVSVPDGRFRMFVTPIFVAQMGQ